MQDFSAIFGVIETERGVYTMNLLEVSNVSKTYGSGGAAVKALKKVSFSVPKGEYVAIVGESGSGKSTLLNMIGALDTPTSGKVAISGKEIFSMNDRKLTIFRRRNIGFIFQAFNLIPELTVEQNIVFPVLLDYQKPDRKYLEELLSVLNLKERRNHLPSQLSGGQQQRVALARIMAYEPDVILLDEPFSALDEFLKDRLQQELYDMLKDYQGTAILVSHDRDEIYRFSEELLIMHQGQVITSGETKKIFADPGYKEAARLTGCKNFSRIQRKGGHKLAAIDWGIELQCAREIPEETAYIGFRAHEFLPIWGERKQNCIKVRLAGSADLPFEKNFYILSENGKGQENICWFLQKEQWGMLREKGLPDYLQFPEEHLLFLS